MHAHSFRVGDLLGDRLPEMRHAAFLGTPRRFHYVALLDGLLIAPVHRIEDNWPGGYRLYGAGRNEGAAALNTSGQAN